QPPAGYPTAKRCFAWRGVAFNLDCHGSDEVAVLDVQVPSDSPSPIMALWAWWTKDLLNDSEAGCVSEIGNWTAARLLSLHACPVLDQNGKRGKFFAHHWKDGKYLIRIIVKGIKYPNQAGVLPQDRLKSILLKQSDIETITEPKSGSDDYCIAIQFPQE
ncbi:MAG: hypothetical protein P4L50_08330, partial [Anaerolineaceae bacterium]|nr:hypothetical protein [Anaerolineaceae bacterium]